MTETYMQASRSEAEEIAATLKQLDVLLASDKLGTIYAADATELRRSVRKMLATVNTDVEALANIERNDIFKHDPTLAQHRYQLIKDIETTKIDFEFDIVPALERLTKEVVEQAKQNPASVDESTLPPTPSGERWTVEKVLSKAEQFSDQATKAVRFVPKAYTFAKALGLVLGIPVP